MPDITMCAGDGCFLKDKCYRHTAKPSTYQSWGQFNVLYTGGGCAYFWDNSRDDSMIVPSVSGSLRISNGTYTISTLDPLPGEDKSKPKKKKTNPEIEEIMAYFDFEAVHKCMVALDWFWSPSDTVPSLDTIKEKALGLLLMVSKSKKKKDYGSFGGFVAKKNKHGLKLSFEVADWDTYKDPIWKIYRKEQKRKGPDREKTF